MKLLYIVDIKMPTPKAHGIHVANMCAALGCQGIDTTLVVPRVNSSITEDPYTFYGLEKTFAVTYVPSVDIVRHLPGIGYWLRFFSFPLFAVLKYLFVSRRDVHVHTRDFVVAYVFRRFGFSVSYEAHRIPTKRKQFFRYLRGIDRIVTNSKGVAEEFRSEGFEHVIALRHGVNLEPFNEPFDAEQFKAEHDLPPEKNIALYSGNLYGWKGVDTLIDAAALMSDRDDIAIALIGGTPPDVLWAEGELESRNIRNVLLLGHQPYTSVPSYLRAADVLILPNNTSTSESVKYTSPTKLPEYMASRTPIIASDLPSLREVLTSENAHFVPPEDATALSNAILDVLDHPDAERDMTEAAYTLAAAYTWDDRAKDVAKHIGL